jgi:hypothetical protein
MCRQSSDFGVVVEYASVSTILALMPSKKYVLHQCHKKRILQKRNVLNVNNFWVIFRVMYQSTLSPNQTWAVTG